VAHITDEHIEPAFPVHFERLKMVLDRVKTIRPDLLISTGDHTTYNDAPSYNLFNQAFRDVGGFVKFPADPANTAGIPFVPVAGNHDNWILCPHDDYLTMRSYTIGDYRFIGFSNDLRCDYPEDLLETEMRKSCEDGRMIVVYHHYPPHGWKGEPGLEVDAVTWRRFSDLMKRYPVVAYLAGHTHAFRTEVIDSEYVAHTAGRTGVGVFGLYALNDNRINHAAITGYTPVIITYPHQYYQGMEYSRSKAEILNVQAYVRTQVGAIRSVHYRLDNGPNVPMTRVGDTDYFEAALDAPALLGEHQIEVQVANTLGSWAQGAHTISVYFADSVPERASPGCDATPRPTYKVYLPLLHVSAEVP
jgi:Icc-related predicted phosphoesterase